MLRVTYFCIAAACAVTSATTCAQVRNFPNRRCASSCRSRRGGIVDVVVRLLGRKMTEVMGQSVVIDNRPGVSTNIGTEMVGRAPGDGYTLLSNSLPLAVNPSMFANG